MTTAAHPTDPADRLARSIADAFRRHLLDEAVPHIEACVRRLTSEQIWRRHGAKGNAVGNLLLHLEGNVRQWILAGIAGQADVRARDAEFEPNGVPPGAEAMLTRLRTTVTEAVAVVAGLDGAALLAQRRFQGRYERDTCGGVLHVLEHFSGHAYQIYAWTKAMTDEDLRFWDLGPAR
jgi:hypothetical protein